MADEEPHQRIEAVTSIAAIDRLVGKLESGGPGTAAAAA